MKPTLNTHPLTGFYWKDNYIWSIGMQLCWNQLIDDILQGPAQIEVDEPGAKELITLFNQKHFDRSSVSPENIYTHAGLGPETLEIIKRDMAERFPGRSTDTLDQLSPRLIDLICFSYLVKQFQHQSRFKEIEMRFLDLSVKGFTLASPLTKGIEILDYDNDENFVLKLMAKNAKDEIILIKGNEKASLQDILSFLAKLPPSYPLNSIDEVQIPNIRLNASRSYSELIGGKLYLNPPTRGHFILTSMEEQIKLSLNHQGARAENEAVMAFTRGLPTKPRKLYLDRPFWLILKEQSAAQPYLIIKVCNEAILDRTEGVNR